MGNEEPCGHTCDLNLTEAGADFEVIPVNMGKGQQNSPDYLKLNPKHKVPVLVIDGEPLTENVVINNSSACAGENVRSTRSRSSS